MSFLACVAGIKGVEDRKEGTWGESVRNTCYKKPHLFISVDTSIQYRNSWTAEP